MDLLDRLEAYHIMSEIFFEYIPKERRVKALTKVAERINYEIKEAKGE